ncbi:MAG: serine--tRNA ligase [Candidatus Njordarchaeia archaeon]
MLRFNGLVRYQFSKEIPEDFVKKLGEFVKEMNEGILARGAKNPEDAAKIVEYSVENNILTLRIESGKNVRVHHAALRVKNYLAPIIGKEYKIGIRNVKLEDAQIIMDGEYRITTMLPFIKNIAVGGGKTIIYLEDLSESELKKPIIDRLLKLVEYKELKSKFGGKAEHWQLIKKSKEKDIRFNEDPNEYIEKMGWIKRYSVGQWFYTPAITHLIRRFQELFIETVLKPLGFMEAIYPKIVPVEMGLKTGHIKGTINQMIFACQPKSYNIEDFDDFIDLVMVLDEVPRDVLGKHLRDPSHWLCFAQCEPFYWFFGNEIIDPDILPIKWFDRSGPSFRWEAGGIKGLERLVEFHRVEVTWLGTPEQVIEIRNKLLERYEFFMDKVLDLEWRWAWVTPFFLVHAGEVEESTEIDINRPGTIDFEAWIPYRGDRSDNNNWLEIGNISIHGTKYTDAFKIKHKKPNEIIWTACSGFGVQRWLIAFLAQKGFDPDNWPTLVREKVGELPSGVRLITFPNKEGKELLDKVEGLFRKKCFFNFNSL